MKVLCSFKTLLRISFWVAAMGLVTGLSLGHQGEAAPNTHVPAASVQEMEVR